MGRRCKKKKRVLNLGEALSRTKRKRTPHYYARTVHTNPRCKQSQRGGKTKKDAREKKKSGLVGKTKKKKVRGEPLGGGGTSRKQQPRGDMIRVKTRVSSSAKTRRLFTPVENEWLWGWDCESWREERPRGEGPKGHSEGEGSSLRTAPPLGS